MLYLFSLFLLNKWCSKLLLAIACIDYILPELSNVLSACIDFLLLLKEANVCCLCGKARFFISWEETKTTCKSWRDEQAKSAHKKGEDFILRKQHFESSMCGSTMPRLA